MMSETSSFSIRFSASQWETHRQITTLTHVVLKRQFFSPQCHIGRTQCLHFHPVLVQGKDKWSTVARIHDADTAKQPFCYDVCPEIREACILRKNRGPESCE
jgi:hypothetical protein